MKDWRDYFSERMARLAKIEASRFANGAGYRDRKELGYMVRLKLVESCRDEAWVAAGGPSYPEVGPVEGHPCITAVRAVKWADIQNDSEKMHFMQAAIDALPPGIFAAPQHWMEADKIRFVNGPPQVIGGYEASP